MSRHILLLIVTLLLLAAPPVYAASVSVAPVGDSSYSVDGSAMEGVTGIELNISYDSASLAAPNVAQGSLIYGAMLAANTTKPGNIRIAIISTRAFASSGQIVALNFASRSGTGGITAALVKMIDIKGKPVATSPVTIVNSVPRAEETNSGMIANAGVPFSQPATTISSTSSAQPSTIQTSSGAVTTAGLISPGTITLQEDSKPKSAAKPTEPEVQPPPVYEPPEPVPPAAVPAEKEAAQPAKAAEAKVTTYKSVLEQFREYSGVKSPAGLSALFNKQIADNIQQKPQVALSDGATVITISVKLDAAADTAPNVALNGAELKSLRRDEAGAAWMIEALPETGVVEATLIVLTGGEMIEYPLTVAPLVKGLSLTDEGFVSFLKAVPAKRDLNGDGRYDYVDNYIFMANYLAKKRAIKPAASDKK